MVITHQEIIIRLVLSAIIGMIMGLEREFKYSPAGMRTHALVCLGSTLFTLASFSIEKPYLDMSRIAAQVALGVGFIGGGVIFKAKDKILGLTTAANLWVLAAIGLIIGIGNYFAAIVTTALALILLIIGSKIERITLKTKDKIKRER